MHTDKLDASIYYVQKKTHPKKKWKWADGKHRKRKKGQNNFHASRCAKIEACF